MERTIISALRRRLWVNRSPAEIAGNQKRLSRPTLNFFLQNDLKIPTRNPFMLVYWIIDLMNQAWAYCYCESPRFRMFSLTMRCITARILQISLYFPQYKYIPNSSGQFEIVDYFRLFKTFQLSTVTAITSISGYVYTLTFLCGILCGSFNWCPNIEENRMSHG